MNFDATRFSLEGKVALIVGGAGDLGHAIVTRFAQSGATVLLTSRKISRKPLCAVGSPPCTFTVR